jgi:hypothetical protein
MGDLIGATPVQPPTRRSGDGGWYGDVDGSLWDTPTRSSDDPVYLIPGPTRPGCPCERWSDAVREAIRQFEEGLGLGGWPDFMWQSFHDNCMALRRQWEACMRSLSETPDTAIWERCEPPPCPPPPPPELNEERCGPDVTNWLADRFGDRWIWANDDVSLLMGGDYFWAEPGGPMDIKEGRTPSMADCPSEECKTTVTLCGKCLSSQVPGNMAFGFTFPELEWKLQYSNERNLRKYKKPDSIEDRAAIASGHWVRVALRQRARREYGLTRKADRSRVLKELICDQVEHFVDVGHMTDSSATCRPCARLWS